jgi:hypothetical protein
MHTKKKKKKKKKSHHSHPKNNNFKLAGFYIPLFQLINSKQVHDPRKLASFDVKS